MKPAVLFLLLFIFCDVFAQQKPFAIEAEVTGSFFTITFRKDSLVPPKRQGKTSFADGLSVNAYFLFTRPDTSLKIRTGIGYNETHFRMNKNNLGDFIVAIFSFGAQNRDSFQINNVDITSRYLNLPLGISYRLAKGRKKKVEAHCGLQLNSSFLISSRSKVFFVNSANHSAQQKQEVEKNMHLQLPNFFYTCNQGLI